MIDAHAVVDDDLQLVDDLDVGPFCVVSDAAHRTLPPAALVGMRSDGNVDLPAVLRSLLSAPWQPTR